MNFAFSSILIILLILPGFIFSLALYQSDEPFYYPPLTNRTIISLFASIVANLTMILLISHLSHWHINYGTLLEFVAGKNIDAHLQSITFTDIIGFSSYRITIYIFAYVNGLILNKLIKQCKLDTKITALRLESPWYYLLNGSDWEIGEPDLILITAAIELAGECYLYDGFLETYYLDKDEELDRLILTDTRRRNIEKDHDLELHGKKTKKSIEERFYPIDGHNFVLKYSNIKNLNIQFLKIEPVCN